MFTHVLSCRNSVKYWGKEVKGRFHLQGVYRNKYTRTGISKAYRIMYKGHLTKV